MPNIFSYESGTDHEILAVPPTDLAYASIVNHGSSNVTYPLIVTVEMSRNDELGSQQLSDIVR